MKAAPSRTVAAAASEGRGWPSTAPGEAQGNRSGMWGWPALVAMLSCCAPPAPAAIGIEWYEQRTPGRADGELRLGGLGEGELAFSTPGRRMETGIKRIGDVAVVILAEPAEPPIGEIREIRDTRNIGDAGPRTLVVVAGQGDRPRVRASFPLAPPEPVLRETPAAPAAPIPDRHAAAPPAVGAVQKEQEEPKKQEKRKVRERKEKTEERAPAVVARPAAPVARPDAPPVCPRLVIPRGSLRATAARLLAECGHRLGRWHPGDADTLVDFEVTETRIARNDGGIGGLLALLGEYGLVGVVRPGTDVVDLFEP